MEQLEHGLRGNCLFHWPAAKGEEVNGKRYESVCPLRWWIRFKLEEEGLSICSALAFPILTTLNCFLSFALQPIRAALIFFLNLSFSFSSISYAPPPMLHCSRVLGLCGLTGWALGGREGKGSICRLRDRKLRQHGLQLEHSVPQESRGHAESQGAMTLSREQRKKINTNPLSLVVGLQASVPRVCVHSLAYGVLLKMD